MPLRAFWPEWLVPQSTHGRHSLDLRSCDYLPHFSSSTDGTPGVETAGLLQAAGALLNLPGPAWLYSPAWSRPPLQLVPGVKPALNLDRVKYVQKVPEAATTDGGKQETVLCQGLGRPLAHHVWLNGDNSMLEIRAC